MGSDQQDLRGVSPDLAAYLGALGRTRTEMAHVWMPDGAIHAIAVYTGIDAAAEPVLAAIACAGTLHQLGHGIELALPFTYHDAARRMFLLVVPDGLRHRALGLRAEHMARIAADVEHAVPIYVRDCEVVIGTAALAERVERGTSTAPSADAADGGGEADVLDARWQALREHELSLERRERVIAAREQVTPLGRSVPARPVLDSEVEEVSDDDALDFGEAALAETVERDELDDVEDISDDDALEDVEDLDDEDGLGGVEQLDDLDDKLQAGRDSASLDLWPFDDRRSVMDALSPSVAGDAATPAPPDGFLLEDASTEQCLVESGGQVWLFVRGRPAAPRDREDLDLLVQLDPAAAVPVVLLTLVFDVGAVPEVRRGAVDMREPEQARALVALGENFEVQLVALEGDGQLSHWATLKGPREQNVNAVLAAVANRPCSREAWLEARQAMLAAPPPWRDLEHPFQIGHAEEHAVSATEAAVALDELVEWSAPERRARLVLLRSVPLEVIEAHYRVGICDALDWGLPLPRSLRDTASELGVASDVSALLLRRIAGLCRTSREPDFGGLEASVLRALWSEVLERAVTVGVELTPEAEVLLRTHVGDRAQAHAEGLAEHSSATLAPLRTALHGQSPDLATLHELAALGRHRDLLEVGGAGARLPPEQAVDLFVRMVARKDVVAGDALRGLLVHTQDTGVRACAALALASLRAVDAIEDLVRRLLVAPESEWPFYALCLGRYGAGSFRAIQRALDAEHAPDDRVAHVYAHLALHGARAQIRARARSQDSREAEVASRAMVLAREIKDANTPALGLEKQGVLTVFCELFDRSLGAHGA